MRTLIHAEFTQNIQYTTDITPEELIKMNDAGSFPFDPSRLTSSIPQYRYVSLASRRESERERERERERVLETTSQIRDVVDLISPSMHYYT